MFKRISGVVSKAMCVGVAAVGAGVVENEGDKTLFVPPVRAEVHDYLREIRCSRAEMNEIIDKASIQYLNRLATEDQSLPEGITFKSVWEASPLFSRYHHDNENCVLFWKNYSELKDLLVVKIMSNDSFGCGHAQAAVCTQHYVVAVNQYLLNNKINNVGMVTIPSLLRHKLRNCLQLQHYLLTEGGGSALQDLILICGLSMEHDLTTLTPGAYIPKDLFCKHVMSRLKREPALVHNFALVNRSGFAVPNGQVSFSAADLLPGRPVPKEWHAMVLVGMRRDDEGQYWFLMQNWWKDKPFVEVSYEFLMAAHTSITFVNKHAVDIPQIGGIEITYHKALSTVLDKGDSTPVEK